MSSDSEVLDALARFEASARRSRPYFLLGLIATLAGFSILVWQLYGQKRAAERNAEEQTRRADGLQATLGEAGEAFRRGDRVQLHRLLQVAQRQTETIGAAAAGQDSRAQIAQVSLEGLEVRIWICNGAPTENRTQAIAFQRMRPEGATQRWSREYLSTDANSRSNYRIVRNEIRYNPNEQAAADQLQQLIRQSFGVEVAMVQTFFPSPNSVSVFFCQGVSSPLTSAADLNTAVPEITKN